MKAALFLLSIVLPLAAYSQNCDRSSTGFPPINDLGKGYYRGYQGGLYPNGENYAPDKHLAEGFRRSLVMPHGIWTKGKIVMVSIGMSNTTQESQAFASLLDTFKSKNSDFIFVDCAEGGMDVTKLLGDTAAYWAYVRGRLVAQSVTPEQVSVIWFKEAEASPRDTVFPHQADTLVRYYTAILQGLKRLLPNAQMCYLSSRIYAGYATSALNPEPYAYESGWAVKWLIEKQIMGDTNLSYGTGLGEGAKVPWLAWGPYLWADGTTPRSDGLTWICPDDYINDGTHPSAVGRIKVAKRLLDFFSHDVTAASWFLKDGLSAFSRFALHAPIEGSVIPPIRDSFSWSPVDGADHYVLKLSQNALEITQVEPVTFSVYDTMLVLDSLPIRQKQQPIYYATVLALDRNNRIIGNTGASFWYRPFRPQIISPADGETNVTLPILRWTTPVGPTDTFMVRLSDDRLLTHILQEDTVFSNSGHAAVTASGLSNNSTYYWSVFAKGRYWLDFYDHPDIWSDTVSFTTGDVAEVLQTPFGSQFTLVNKGALLQYSVDEPVTVEVAAVDVLGRERMLARGALSQTGTLPLPKPDEGVLFYVVRRPGAQYVLRAQ